jgi:hypothetical protein
MAAPKAKVQFSASAYAVAENAGSATVTVVRPRSGHSTVRLKQAVSVDYTTIDGTAQAGTDYEAAHGTLNFPACSGSPATECLQQTFTVPVDDNFVVDGPRTLTLKLSNATSLGHRAILGFPSTAVLVIADDENAGAGSGSTFQMAVASDFVSEPATSGSEPVFVIRSGDLSTGASVHYSTGDGAAAAGTDYTTTTGTLNFPAQTAGDASSIIQEVDVPLSHNPATAPQLRDFNFGLDIPAGNGGTLGTPSSENVVIVNSDGPATLLWSSPSYSTAETAGSVRLTAIAAGSITGNDEVDVDYQTADGTAKAGVNYTASGDTLQFFAGDLAESVDIPVQNDGLAGDKAFTTSLVNPASGVIGEPGTATINVLDAVDRSSEAVSGTGTGTGTGTPQGGGSQVVAGARQSACGLTVKATKKQKLVKAKSLKLKLKATSRCKLTVATTITQLRSKSHKRQAQIVRALRLKGKNASLTLQPGKAKTVKVKFTKKTLKAITKALRARKNLVATVVVTERISASKVKRHTLKITIKR